MPYKRPSCGTGNFLEAWRGAWHNAKRIRRGRPASVARMWGRGAFMIDFILQSWSGSGFRARKAAGLFAVVAFFSQGVRAADVFDSPASESSALESSAASGLATTTMKRDSWLKRVARDFSVGFFNFSSVPMDQANQQAARIDAYNYFTFDYRIDRSRKISLRPVFQFGTAGTDYRNEYKASDFRLGDAFLNYTEYNIAILPADIEFSAQMRVYAPTSKTSSDQGLITRLRPWFIFSRTFSRSFEIVFNLEPDYYVQSRTGFLDDRNRVKGNRDFGYESSVDFNYRFNRTFGATTSVGHNEMWSHRVPVERVRDRYHTEELTLDASLNMGLKGLFMVAGVSQKRDIARPRGTFALMRENESQYYLLSSVRF
jgi:hypothetical protein